MYVKRCVLNQYQIYIYIYILIFIDHTTAHDNIYDHSMSWPPQPTAIRWQRKSMKPPSVNSHLNTYDLGSDFSFSGGRSTSIRVEGSKKIQETMSEICVLPAMESLDSTWCTNALPWYHWSGRLCCHSRRPGLRISQDIKLLDVPNQILLSS